MVTWLKRHKILLTVVLVLISFNLLFFCITPEEIVAQIGVENSYLVAFLLAAIGGVSTFTGTALYATIATFAAGGAHPLLLGFIAGIGIFISNSLFFLLARLGRKSIQGQLRYKVVRIAAWVEVKMPHWLTLILVYLYLSFSPFSDDLLMIGLVIAGYKYRHVAPVLLAGGISLATFVAYLGIFWF